MPEQREQQIQLQRIARVQKSKCSIGSENVIINNKLAFRVGDKDTPHGVPCLHPVVLYVFHVTSLTQGSPMYMLTVDHWVE